MEYEIRPPGAEPSPVRVSPTMIDVEWNHPDFGWIPFTSSSEAVEQYSRDIYALAETMIGNE